MHHCTGHVQRAGAGSQCAAREKIKLRLAIQSSSKDYKEIDDKAVSKLSFLKPDLTIAQSFAYNEDSHGAAL